MAPAFGAPDMVAPGDPMMMSPRVINTAAPKCPFVSALPVNASWSTWRISSPAALIPFALP